jgi:hypothetical protein
VSLRTLEGEEVEHGSLGLKDSCPLPGPRDPCLLGLVLVWQSRELGHELVVIILREADMQCLKLLLVDVDRPCALQEVVGAGRKLTWCRFRGQARDLANFLP